MDSVEIFVLAVAVIIVMSAIVTLIVAIRKSRKKIDDRMNAQELARQVDAHTSAYARNKAYRTTNYTSSSSSNPAPRPSPKHSRSNDENYAGFVATEPAWYNEPTQTYEAARHSDTAPTDTGYSGGSTWGGSSYTGSGGWSSDSSSSSGSTSSDSGGSSGGCD